MLPLDSFHLTVLFKSILIILIPFRQNPPHLAQCLVPTGELYILQNCVPLSYPISVWVFHFIILLEGKNSTNSTLTLFLNFI